MDQDLNNRITSLEYKLRSMDQKLDKLQTFVHAILEFLETNKLLRGK